MGAGGQQPDAQDLRADLPLPGQRFGGIQPVQQGIAIAFWRAAFAFGLGDWTGIFG